MKTSNLATKHIRTDGGTQTREEINESAVAEYAEALAAGVQLPPAIIFHDGTNNWLADGFHRYWGAVKIGKALLCEIHPGTRRDAVLYAAGANATHGLRRSNETKRRAVLMLVDDAEWSQWSDRVIAEKCGVSHEFVRKMRPAQVSTVDTSNEDSGGNRYHLRQGADGKKYPAPAPKLAPEPTPQTEEGDDLGPDPFADEPAESLADIAAIETEEDEPVVDVPESEEPYDSDDAATGHTITIDTLSQVEAEREEAAQADTQNPEELDDARWLFTLPAYRWLQRTGNRGLFFKRAALDYRLSEKAIVTFQRAINSGQSLKMADKSPFYQVVSPLMSLKHPRFWRVCGGCKGDGCARCSSTGYDLAAGMDALVLLEEAGGES